MACATDMNECYDGDEIRLSRYYEFIVDFSVEIGKDKQINT